MEFKEGQTTLTINANTPIISTTRGQQGMTTSQLKAVDLKEGDIVTIWLDETNKTTAQYVMLRKMPANAGKEGNKQ
ncbi:hypothetical protein Back11_33260 [Paenibacillus baekrokdamisoli]|uniref:Uncharacterized protein n=1 Tax=Paenibacillus baekrokdamisoli TaxID=1712516 RepID=A0A3G9J866_9BACL|nr:hypothetical protein [Paenibacillus baekrokdamisoli]MBB3072905.1 hypothetical protein [Paenibacillus baekrokdamisoli]BBH21981.1 hypothetical protein Back11_33260 [Paenibacillus baekrokdamisoli]